MTHVEGPKPFGPLPTGPELPGQDEELVKEITQVLRLQDELWQTLDFAGLAAIWDMTYDVPIYVGDEYSAPVIGWHDLGRHWGRLGGRLREAWVSSTLLAAGRIGDVAVVVYLMEWRFVAVESPEARSGQRWVSATLRPAVDGWRFVNQAESPAHSVDAKTVGWSD